MSGAAIGQVAFDYTRVAPLLIRIGDMIRAELSEHGTHPSEFFIGVWIVRDEPALPSIEILELGIQFSRKVGLFIMQVTRDLAIRGRSLSTL